MERIQSMDEFVEVEPERYELCARDLNRQAEYHASRETLEQLEKRIMPAHTYTECP